MSNHYIPNVPAFWASAISGHAPVQWFGVDPPDGDDAYWKDAPVGSRYWEIDQDNENVRLWMKVVNAHLDSDWVCGAVPLIAQRVTLADFTDGGSTSGTLELNQALPIGAVVDRVYLFDVEGFIGDTSAALQVGDDIDDADRYNASSDPSVFADATMIDCGAPQGTAIHTAAAGVVLTITSGSDFGKITAGAFTIMVFGKLAQAAAVT